MGTGYTIPTCLSTIVIEKIIRASFMSFILFKAIACSILLRIGWLPLRLPIDDDDSICASLFSVYRKWTESKLLFRGILIKDCGKSLNVYGSSNIGIERTRCRHRCRVKNVNRLHIWDEAKTNIGIVARILVSHMAENRSTKLMWKLKFLATKRLLVSAVQYALCVWRIDNIEYSTALNTPRQQNSIIMFMSVCRSRILLTSHGFLFPTFICYQQPNARNTLQSQCV